MSLYGDDSFNMHRDPSMLTLNPNTLVSYPTKQLTCIINKLNSNFTQLISTSDHISITQFKCRVHICSRQL